MTNEESNSLYYGDYLELDKILKASKKGLLNPTAILAAVDHIAAEYNVKDHDVNKDISVKFAKPQLILSESFK